jgi:hypothetical protein
MEKLMLLKSSTKCAVTVWCAVAVWLVFLVACPYVQANKRTARPSLEGTLKAVLNKQCDAWNCGNLDEFMKSYLNSEETSFTSGGTEVWGYQALHDRYEKKYGNSRKSMGKLQFSGLKVLPLGQKNALVIGHWHLDPQNPPPVEGIFSLVFEKTADGWKIMHDHTSVEKKAP